jgi:hypothetical protein
MTTPQDPPVAAERSPQTPPRKAYQRPELQAYGDLAEITQALTGSKTPDGGGHPNKHFTS